MPVETDICAPGSASQWYDLGVLYRQNARFGDAINAFQTAADLALEESCELLRSRAIASIELIREINGFVNADLMNP